MSTTEHHELTGAEQRRLDARKGLFERRGMVAVEAEHLAECCLIRDRQMDDLHVCIECQHLQEGGFCKATKDWALQKDMFHRCHRFEWQVPRAN